MIRVKSKAALRDLSWDVTSKCKPPPPSPHPPPPPTPYPSPPSASRLSSSLITRHKLQKVGGRREEAIRVTSESLPLSFAYTEWGWQWHTSNSFDCKSATRKDLNQTQMLRVITAVVEESRCELRFGSPRYSHSQLLPASSSSSLSCLVRQLASLRAH